MRNSSLTKHLYGSKRRICFLFCLYLLGLGAMAQGRVDGSILDTRGQPIPGATILEKGTNNGTVSDADGNFNMIVGENATLVISFIGFLTQEIPLNGRTKISVTLEENAEILEEVVVIGYGSQLKESISGSVAQINTDALKDIPQVGIDQLIQGRAAGVTVTQNSGQPGSSVSVRIRGVNSLQGSSEPLYIIDGVPVSGDSRNIGTSGRDIADNGIGEDAGSTGVSPLAAINPNDIENIVVLKDASSTAIYGSRGSNGVVLITTKKGRMNEAKLSYSTYLGVQRPTNMIDLMDLKEYAILQNTIGDIYSLDRQTEFLHPELLGEGTNWQREIFDDAKIQNHQLSFSGGNNSVNYFFSTSYTDQDGIVIGSGFDRITVRSNVSVNLTDHITSGITLTASRTKEQITLNNSFNGIISLALLNNPATAVYNPDGSFAGPVTDDEIAFGIRNPVAEALSLQNELKRNKLLGNVYTEIRFTDYLTFRSEIGGDFGFNKSDRFQPTFSYGAINRGINQLNVRRESSDFWILKNLLTYHGVIANIHDLTVLVGQEAQESSWEGVIAQDGTFVGNDVPVLGTGNSNDFTEQYKGSAALASYFSRVIYSLMDKYSITASIRADGSSKFAEGNRWGYFPSVSAAWQLSREPFLRNFVPVSDIKLYGGYGVVGNQDIPGYAYGIRLTPVNTDLGTGFEEANFGFPDLTWESSRQINLGVDFSLFKSSLRATVEVYQKISKDFLYQFAATDFVTGGDSPGAVTAPWINIGEMENRGIDVALRYNNHYNIGKGLNWSSNLTVSHYQNKVRDLLGAFDVNGINQSINLESSDQNITFTQKGKPLGLIYGYQVEGLFRSLADIEGAPQQFGRPFQDALFSTTWLGDIKFKDVNKDGVVNGDDRTIIGNPHPDFTFGWQNSLSYGNFELSIFLQGSYGNDIFNALDRTLTAGNRTYANQSPVVLDYWSVNNPNAKQPRLARNDTPNTNISDRYIEDGSYMRIQNLTLGYTLPANISNKATIERFKIYGSVQNLYTLTNYSGYDPEVGSLNQNPLLMGIDNGRYPSPRTFTIGLHVDF